MKKGIIILVLLSFSFLACPPPGYRLKFNINDSIQKKAIIKEGDKRIEISGQIIPYPEWDRLWIKFHFRGFDAIDSCSCANRIEYFTNSFKVSGRYGLVYTKPDKCGLYLIYYHKYIRDMSSEEFENYLNSLNLEIAIIEVFSDTQKVSVIFDKDWIIKNHRIESR